MEANGQFIKPSAWLPPGHDPGAASGEATTARQQGRWPSTFWLSSLEQSDAAAKSAAPFSCIPMRCECVAERASEQRVQKGGRALGPVTPASRPPSVRGHGADHGGVMSCNPPPRGHGATAPTTAITAVTAVTAITALAVAAR